MVFIYILIGRTGRYYTGITKDIVRRFREHQEGKSKSTKNMCPVSIVYLNLSYDHKNAHKLELIIKQKGAQKFLKDLYFNPNNNYGKIYTMDDILKGKALRFVNNEIVSSNNENDRQSKKDYSNNNHNSINASADDTPSND